MGRGVGVFYLVPAPLPAPATPLPAAVTTAPAAFPRPEVAAVVAVVRPEVAAVRPLVSQFLGWGAVVVVGVFVAGALMGL